MRTVYLGTSAFAATVLEQLAASAHRPRLVVTRPDRPRGRGRRLAAPPVAETARRLGLELAQPADIGAEDARALIDSHDPEAICVCAFGALIREPLLSAYPMLNVHPSLLPRWRGAAPVERAIMAGDAITGVSIMEVTAGLDSGPVLAQRAEPIAPEDTYGTLAPRLAAVGAELLLAVLDARPAATPQPDEGVTYAEKIAADDRELSPDRPADELARTVRALSPHIGAFLQAESVGRLGVLAARPTASGPAPGTLATDGPLPVFGTVDGGLELAEVQPAGRRAMGGADFLRGLPR